MADTLEEMTEDQVLAFAGACAEIAWRAEVDLLRAAYQWAVLHAPDRLDPAETAKPGRERVKQLGGPGTPEVTEFAAAGLGARIGRSSYAAARLIGDALDLCHRHPQLWARVQAGEVRASYARHVVARTRDLQPVQAAYVDAGVAESADGRICWSRFEALVEAKIAQADPDAAREKEQQAARATFAKKLPGEAHGMASFLVRADVATITSIAAAVRAIADHIALVLPDAPDLATHDQRSVHAVLLALTGARLQPHHPDTGTEPDGGAAAGSAAGTAAGSDAGVDVGVDISKLLPRVQLYVHLYPGPDREAIARVEGHGPVTTDWVRETLGPKARFTIRPVLDVAGQAPVDSYEIPDRHRQAVHLMTPADVFPYAACTTRAMQIDHTLEHAAGGVSGIGNYGPMTTPHHRVKTHGHWQVRQPFPGIYLWRDPHGGHYLVDHTGTRALPSNHTRPEPRRRRPPRIDLGFHPPDLVHVDLPAA